MHARISAEHTIPPLTQRPLTGQAFADFVARLRSSSPDDTLLAPSFSHSLKDPVNDDVAIQQHHRIVLFEGLYANVDDGEWARAARLFDERWVVECDEHTARTRLIARHVVTGVARDEAEAAWRGEWAGRTQACTHSCPRRTPQRTITTCQTAVTCSTMS